MRVKILFGYKGECFSTLLFDDGTLVYGRADQNTVMRLCEKTMRQIRRILRDNRKLLHQCGEKINGKEMDGENCFIFEDYHIVDWDLTRWYHEEDRKKHPEYYNNTVKLELVETYVLSLFDEICIVIEGAEKEVKYTRSVMVV